MGGSKLLTSEPLVLELVFLRNCTVVFFREIRLAARYKCCLKWPYLSFLFGPRCQHYRGRGGSTQSDGFPSQYLDALPQLPIIHEVGTRSPQYTNIIVTIRMCPVLLESLAGRVDEHVGVS